MKARTIASSLAVAAVLVFLGSPSYASTAVSSDEGLEVTEVPMVLAGYDESVAEAHGFQIVTNEDGTVESVPVTPQAIAISNASNGDALARGVVVGNCGSSFVTANRSGRQVTAHHGYNVPLPVAQRIGWRVYFTSTYGVQTVYTPNGISAQDWSEYSGVVLPGVSSGTAKASGDVLMINGAICHSGNPRDDF